MGVPQFFGYLLKQYKKYGFVFNKDKKDANLSPELIKS